MCEKQPLGSLVENWSPPVTPPHLALDGQYVRLEPLNADIHAGDVHGANARDADGAMWTYLATGPYASPAAYSRWMREAANGNDPQYYAVRNLATGRAAGVLSYMRIKPESGSIEVGALAFSPELQRSRAASEAVILMARNAFALGYRRFEWKCHAHNQPSRRAAERYGFSFEGVFRQSMVVKGRNRDTAWFAMIDTEFAAIDAAYRDWLAPRNFMESGQQIRALSSMTRPLLVASDPSLTS